ncbi:hypothetical protein FTO68_05085 [Methanocalculus taiwanensis]|uniref:S-layer protein n=1 Tax=Methanocalculus taiwanensis TaxID=106207 RepID=A0ABD4TKU7_9EURY|nr:hypothetical protein [Methanocalculus taiwanensis]MCQ1538364.1 hypothetical protein [Methanocalculus taiwanensis]
MAYASIPVCVLTAIVLLAAFAPGVAEASGQSVIVTDHTLVPPVVMPGESALLHVTILNAASTSTKTESTYLSSVYSVSTSESADIYLVIGSVYLDGRGDIRVLEGNSAFTGVLGPGQSMDMVFLIQAPEKSGIYFPRLRIRIRGGESVIYPIPVNVNMPIFSMKAPVILVSQEALPFVSPGETFETELVVSNAGQSAAQEITVLVQSGDLMIAPVGSASLSMPALAPGAEIVLPLSFRVSKEITSGLYDLPVAISYYEADGSMKEMAAACSIDVRGSSALSVSSVKTDPVAIVAGEPFDLIVRLENTGTGRASSVIASIDVPFSGNREAFVGSIRPGNDAPAIFRLNAGEGGEINTTLSVGYSDDYGDHRLVQPLTLVVRRQGMEGAVIAVVLCILLAGAGYYLWCQRKKE